METATYKITGMSCQGCVGSVTRALTAALPGAKITVELEGGLARIDGAHEPAAVKQAVEDAGFDFVGTG
ncbi:MAG: heavy-metal-associated domain-containing protein [Deltaproteobacteria bacterium]|nr:heavy-metal-associated domain-containing protein [Deltaproteobacteria bacterium]